jgi:hypothetical protein
MRTTAASLALCALEQPHLAKKSPFARAGPTGGKPPLALRVNPLLMFASP